MILRHNIRLSKAIICLLLSIMLIFSTVFVSTVFAADDLAETGETNYYLWGQNSNSPNFDSMGSPTGKFSYSASEGYYFDLPKSAFGQGDYCFVISTEATSGGRAVNNQAMKSAASGSSYYLQYGNYSSYTCFHIWNNDKDAVRISFTSATSGVSCVKGGSSPTTSPTTTPTVKPTTSPTVKPTSAPTAMPTQTPGGKLTVYCKNDANWSSVNVYMWNSDSDKNAAWPGVAMKSIGDKIYQYDLPKNFANIIFNTSGTKTDDMTFPGNGYMYNNSTNEWSIYDDSPLKIHSFTTDIASPQYEGTEIKLSADASGIGTVLYKFSVTNNSTKATEVIKDFSNVNSAVWTPQTPASYTITFDFKDNGGNTNKRTLSYVIEDDSTVVNPILKMVSPSGGYIQKGRSQRFDAIASGGNVGTKLLFYKYEIKDNSGNTVNVPYFTLNKAYDYNFPSIGNYTLTVSVQGSDDQLVSRTYSYTVVSDVPTPTLRGDSNENGKVDVSDATLVQQYLAKLITSSALNLQNADADLDGYIRIADATTIQQYLAKIIHW